MVISLVAKDSIYKFKILFKKSNTTTPFLTNKSEFEIEDANLEFLKKMNIRF